MKDYTIEFATLSENEMMDVDGGGLVVSALIAVGIVVTAKTLLKYRRLH
jgi:lactobin A/cerein 7B family class IIb bacteriocin